MSDYKKNLALAKKAYKEIMQVINKYEGKNDGPVYFCWDGCIQVHDDFFQENELKDDNEE